MLFLLVSSFAFIVGYGVQPSTDFNITKAHEDFQYLDSNKDGYIDAQELRTNAVAMTESDLTTIFTKYDGGNDGVLSFEEYLIFLKENDGQKNR